MNGCVCVLYHHVGVDAMVDVCVDVGVNVDVYVCVWGWTVMLMLTWMLMGM